MDEIIINRAELVQQINQLKKLKAELESGSLPTRNISIKKGSGNIINQIYEISKAYESITDSFSVLLSNSITFFENLGRTATVADEAAGRNF